MRLPSICTIFLLIVPISVYSQNVRLVEVSPSTIKGNDKADAADNGIRTVNLILRLSGKAGNLLVPLTINGAGIASRPRLLDSVIRIRSNQFANRRKDSVDVPYEFRIQLPGLACQVKDDSFMIALKGKMPVQQDTLLVKHFTPVPATATLSLQSDSSTIAPFIADEAADGIRTVKLRVRLAGRPPANDMPLRFAIPTYALSQSAPQLVNDVNMMIPKERFSADGCPVTLEIPVAVRIKRVAKSSDESIPVMLTGNDSNAHFLVIKKAQIPVDTIKKDQEKPGFTHACINRNFIISMKQDSVGGQVEVTDEKTRLKSVFGYKNFFHTGNFSQWFSNVFGRDSSRAACNDCASCGSYLAERIAEELEAAKKTTPSAQSLAENKTAAVALKKDTAVADKKDTAQKGAVPDNITHKFYLNYEDTVAYTVEINRQKTKTDIKICREPKKGKDSCDSVTMAEDIDRETYDRLIPQMLQKLRGEDPVKTAAISPPLDKQYDDYQKVLDEKNPKEKPKAVSYLEGILKNDSLRLTRVGTIFLKDSMVNVYDENDNLVKKVKIDSVTFSISDGKLSKNQLFVDTKDGSFTTTSAPISVNRINKRSTDRLFSEEFGNRNHILLGDVLYYRSSGGYIPDDMDEAVVSPKKPAKVLNAGSNLNSLINVAIYTDLPGLLGRRANGIINTDISGRFITNTRNLRNRDITFFSDLETNLVLSKFDSRFKSLDSADVNIDTIAKTQIVDRMQLMQTAWLKGSIKFNIASWNFMPNQYLQLNIGARINAVNADSFYRKETDILFFDYPLELLYNIKRLKNFGTDLSIRWLFQRIADKESFSNKGWDIVFNPQVSFYYFPSNNSSSRVYLKFNYFASRDKEARNFYQLQFGYKTSLKLSK